MDDGRRAAFSGMRSSHDGRSSALPLRYVPYHRLEGAPNVIVDGSPTQGTVLVLSHWPNMGAPEGLEEDLSAEMAFAYLARADLHGPATLVSNNHFDQDGLVSVYALTAPEEAVRRRRALVGLAAAGDFAVYDDRRCARASMVVAAYADPERSPLGPAGDDYGERAGELYSEMLGRLPEIVDHPERYRSLWEDEDACLAGSEAIIASGEVAIEDLPELDLAIVTVPSHAPREGGHRFGGMWSSGLHPMAVHNATPSFTLLTIHGRRYEVSYRYESWVQYRSRRPRPRVDLSGLADQLNDAEGADRWVFDGVGELTPALHLVGAGDSDVTPERFVALACRALRTGAAAWDPYTPGAAVPGGVAPSADER